MVDDDLLGSGYTSNEIRGELNAGFNAEGADVIESVEEIVQLPTSKF